MHHAIHLHVMCLNFAPLRHAADGAGAASDRRASGGDQRAGDGVDQHAKAWDPRCWWTCG